MGIQVYINFSGNCREAMEYYAQIFGSEPPQFMTFGQAPPNPEHPLPESAKDLIMHTQIKIGGSTVMASDTFPGMPFVLGNNISLTYLSQEVDALKHAFDKLKEGGQVYMELQQTFWTKCYGSLVDKYGINWQLSHDNGEAS